MTTVQDQSPCPVEAIGRGRYVRPTIAELLAENDRLYRVSSEASDAVTAIEYAAKDAVAASEPVTVPVTWFNPNLGKAVTCVALLRDGMPCLEGDAGDAALRATFLYRDLLDGEDLPPADREIAARFQAARQESIERADAIRAKVYAEMGYDAAKAAAAAATEAAAAHSERLWNAPINTMADAIAALEYIRDTNEDWQGLGDRALAFLREKAA